jgi:hypothetical protein
MYKKIMIGIILVISLLVINNNLSASGGGGGLIFGKIVYNLDELNTRLKNAGFESLDESLRITGGGGYSIGKNKIIIGGHGGGFMQEVTSNTYTATFAGGYGFFNIGYLIFSKKGINISSVIGIGGGGVSLRIAKKYKEINFDDILTNPNREANLSTDGLMLQIGIALDYFLKLAEDQKGKAGLLFSIHTGYIFAPFETKWMLWDKEVTNSPEISLSGPYLHFTIGGAGFKK